MRAPRPQLSDNVFEFNRMRNPVGTANFLKPRLTVFILNNILASVTRDIGISSQDSGVGALLDVCCVPPTAFCPATDAGLFI